MKVQIKSLRPTQSCIGFYEVQKKLDALQDLHRHPNKLKDYKRLNPAPVIKGPHDKLYIIDHHHLSRALLKLNEQDIFVKVIKDYSTIPKNTFEAKLIAHDWVYLKDQNGNSVTFDDLPDSILDLKDDPYRSLAGMVRDKHGFRKTAVPFVEFQWADFFRKHNILRKGHISGSHIEKAILLAHSDEAKCLPGWVSERENVQLLNCLHNKLS